MQAGKKNSMTAERVELLNKLGFVWIATADIPWETRIEQLKEYKKLHGNCLVPNKYREENGLGRWVDKQRQVSMFFFSFPRILTYNSSHVNPMYKLHRTTENLRKVRRAS